MTIMAFVPMSVAQRGSKPSAKWRAKEESQTISPVSINGRKIAESFWGKAWCDDLERYSDYANRCRRRAYVRNGSVVDLEIKRGMVRAMVSAQALQVN